MWDLGSKWLVADQKFDEIGRKIHSQDGMLQFQKEIGERWYDLTLFHEAQNLKEVAELLHKMDRDQIWLDIRASSFDQEGLLVFPMLSHLIKRE